MDVLRAGRLPSEVITKEALENAIAAGATSGGSTNSVLHLLAVAHELGIRLPSRSSIAISERTPLLCDLQPGGRYVATDLYRPAGFRSYSSACRRLGHCMAKAITVTGKTIGEHAAEAQETAGQR